MQILFFYNCGQIVLTKVKVVKITTQVVNILQ